MLLTEFDFIKQLDKHFLIVCVFYLTPPPFSGMNVFAHETVVRIS